MSDKEKSALSRLQEEYKVYLDPTKPRQPQIVALQELARQAAWDAGELVYTFTSEQRGRRQQISWSAVRDGILLKDEQHLFHVQFGAMPQDARTSLICAALPPMGHWHADVRGDVLYADVHQKGIVRIGIRHDASGQMVMYPFANMSALINWGLNASGLLILCMKRGNGTCGLFSTRRPLASEQPSWLYDAPDDKSLRWIPSNEDGAYVLLANQWLHVRPGLEPIGHRMELVCNEFPQDANEKGDSMIEMSVPNGIIIQRNNKVYRVRRWMDSQRERMRLVYRGDLEDYGACAQGLVVVRNDEIRLFRF